MVKLNDNKEKETPCSICGEDIRHGWCEECYGDISNTITELASIHYTIQNCRKEKTDDQMLFDIILLANELKEHAEHLQKKMGDL